MLEKALKILSPTEKMDKMKAQLNAKIQTNKVTKSKITLELNKKSSESEVHNNDKDQS